LLQQFIILAGGAYFFAFTRLKINDVPKPLFFRTKELANLLLNLNR